MKRTIALICITLSLMLTFSCDKDKSFNDGKIKSISLSPAPVTGNVGDIITLNAAIEPENASEQYTLVWNITPEDIAAYDQATGKITLLKEGNATLSVSLQARPEIKAQCTVTVAELVIPVEEVTLDPVALSGNIGDIIPLRVAVSPQNVNEPYTLVWAISPQDAATYDEATGMITLIKPGATTIEVSLQARPEIKAQCIAEAEGEITFTDTDFSIYVKAEFDANNDGKIMYSEVKNVQEIDINNTSVADLGDIAYFTSLKKLECGYTYLEALDLSSNTKLEYLNCSENYITALDLSKNTALTYLDCGTATITSLDLSKNTALAYLDCQTNQLASLILPQGATLNKLVCVDNRLTALDVSKCTGLTFLSCGTNWLTSLDISKNTAITSLFCKDNSSLTQILVWPGFDQGALTACFKDAGASFVEVL